MKNMKSILLAAVAVSGVSANIAHARSVIAPVLVGADIRGAGASAVEGVVVRAHNCLSGPVNNQPVGRGAPAASGGSTEDLPEFSYTPASPTATNPAFNCATQGVQPNYLGRYISTGSGFGREIWRNFSNRFISGVPAATQANPFEPVTGVWTNVQYAFSEGPIVASDVTAYNANANSATNLAGNPIQFPLYVVPVALAYNPRYGTTALGTPLIFTAPAVPAVGNRIRITTSQYCAIFNGVINNWKQLVGTGQTLRATGLGAEQAAEDARWAADGVPIRLVGRLDNSGTTDIFTRHLSQATVCGTTGNKFTGNNQALPATAISTAVFDGPGGTLSAGTEVAGLFGRATGSSRVRDAVNAAPEVLTANGNGTLLNGKLGYISADFVAPADTNGAVAAQLPSVGSATANRLPTPANATAAFSATLLPPQTTAASGVYNPADNRRNSANPGTPVNRGNPLDWSDVLYSRADQSGGFTGPTLASPTAGYPITGVSFMLTSTCFKTEANRAAISLFIAANLGQVNTTSTWVSGPTNLSPNTFIGVGNPLGLLPRDGFAPLPASWRNAIRDTFLRKLTGPLGSNNAALGNRGLWISGTQPTTSLTVPAPGFIRNSGGSSSNVGGITGAACTAGSGA